MNQFVAKPIQPQRAASLNRFREKRKERCFDKKIRYNVRKEVAMRYFILFTFYCKLMLSNSMKKELTNNLSLQTGSVLLC